jgi:hypothetical protein
MVNLGVPIMEETEFDCLLDGLSCLSPGQGLGTFNRKDWPVHFISTNPSREFRRDWLKKATGLYRYTMAVIHISGGPAPRGTEEAVTRLLNSDTELMRNVLVMNGTIGVQNGYVNLLANLFLVGDCVVHDESHFELVTQNRESTIRIPRWWSSLCPGNLLLYWHP